MKHKDGPNNVLLCWREAFGWDAVYAPKKRGGPLRTKPIIGWGLVAVLGRSRNPALAVHGVHSFIANELTLAGREKSFLGYARAGEDLRARFGKRGCKTAWRSKA